MNLLQIQPRPIFMITQQSAINHISLQDFSFISTNKINMKVIAFGNQFLFISQDYLSFLQKVHYFSDNKQKYQIYNFLVKKRKKRKTAISKQLTLLSNIKHVKSMKQQLHRICNFTLV